MKASEVPERAYYSLEDGQFVVRAVMMDGSERVVERCSEVAIVISEVTGFIVRHGCRKAVEGWARDRKNISVAVILPGFPIEELNKAVSDWPNARKVIELHLRPLLRPPSTEVDGKKNEEEEHDDGK